MLPINFFLLSARPVVDLKLLLLPGVEPSNGGARKGNLQMADVGGAKVERNGGNGAAHGATATAGVVGGSQAVMKLKAVSHVLFALSEYNILPFGSSFCIILTVWLYMSRCTHTVLLGSAESSAGIQAVTKVKAETVY